MGSSARVTTADGLDQALTAPGFFADPYSVYARLRDESPVHWCEPWQQWVITPYELVAEVIDDPRSFSSAGWEGRFLERLPASEGDFPHLRRHYATRVMSMSDPPLHTRLRGVVARSFTPRVLEALRPRIASIADGLLADVGAATEVDVLAEFAYPLAAFVIADLLGAPEERREDFIDWSRAVVDFVGTGSPEPARARRLEEALAAFRAFLQELIELRRAEPSDDLLTLLVQRGEEGDALSDDELVSTAVVLLFAGHETTANLVANGLLALLRHPAQLEILRRDPAVARAAVEELLRYDSPVQRNRRVASTDIAFHGAEIRRGDQVMAFLGAANRDPARFDDPDRLDVERRSNPHLAFGHGIHYCIGAALSRLEAPIAFSALLDRFPSLSLPSGFEESWRPNITFRGLESLVIQLRS